MNELVALGLLFGAAIVAVLLLRRGLQSYNRRKPAAEEDEVGLNLSSLILELGEVELRSRARNRILALGPSIIPELLTELIYHRFHIEAAAPTLVSELEGLISDFGPSAMEPLTTRLIRWEPTHRCAPALLRVIESLGDDNYYQLLDSRSGDGYSPRPLRRFLNHLLLRRKDARTCNLLIDNRQERPADELLVTMQPREWATLWLRLSPRVQSSFVEWMHDWSNLLDISFLEFLLLQADSDHLPRILDLIPMNPHPELLPLVSGLCDHDDEMIKYAAIEARTYFSPIHDDSYFLSLLEHERCAYRLLGLKGLIMAGSEVAHDPKALKVMCQDLLWTDTRDLSELAELLYSKLTISTAETDQKECEMCALLYLALESQPTVAAERLLALSSVPVPQVRVAATLALTLHRDQRAPEAFKRCLQVLPAQKFKATLQVIASGIGAAGARIVAKRLYSKTHHLPTTDPTLNHANTGTLILSLLHCLPFASATDILLELIEADGQNPMTPRLALTLKSGGRCVRQEISKALGQPERGLVLPAVRYLSMCPDPLLIDDLLRVYSNFDVVRSQVLTVLEYLGPKGLEIIKRAIEEGGDDRQLDPLLETESWFKHCVQQADEGGRENG